VTALVTSVTMVAFVIKVTSMCADGRCGCAGNTFAMIINLTIHIVLLPW